MTTDDEVHIRARIDANLDSLWTCLLDRHNITQNAALKSLIRFVTTADPLLVALLFEQLPRRDYVAISRLALAHVARAERLTSPLDNDRLSDGQIDELHQLVRQDMPENAAAGWERELNAVADRIRAAVREYLDRQGSPQKGTVNPIATKKPRS